MKVQGNADEEFPGEKCWQQIVALTNDIPLELRANSSRKIKVSDFSIVLSVYIR